MDVDGCHIEKYFKDATEFIYGAIDNREKKGRGKEIRIELNLNNSL